MNPITKTEIDEYINECWDKAHSYAEDLRSKKIKVPQYITAVNEWSEENEMYELRRDNVNMVFALFYLINILNDDEGYQRISLMRWQAWVIAMLFGFYVRGTDIRRFNKVLLFIPKGNGKSPFGQILSILFLVAAGFVSPNILFFSTVENRKKNLKDLQDIIENSPEIYPYLHFNNFSICLNGKKEAIRLNTPREIIRTNDSGSIKVVPSSVKKVDGANLVFAFVDEVHLLEDETLVSNLEKALDKRKNSLLFMCTTAGYETKSFFTDLIEKSKKVALGEIEEPGLLPILYCLDPWDDVEDIGNEEFWEKTNPSLGVLKDIKNMKKYYHNSLYSPKDKAEFIVKDLNVFIDYNENQILDDEDFKKAYQPVDLEKWRGKPVYLGLDLSKTNDLSSLNALFHDEENDKWESVNWYWIANDSILMTRKDGKNLNDWINRGLIQKCNDKYIDYGLIVNKIKELHEQFDVRGIGYDPYAWNLFQKYLLDAKMDLIETIPIPQVTSHQAEPLSNILISIKSDKLIFSDSPVTLWNWKNARIRVYDKNGNLKICKDESKESVDGAVALNNAMALYFKVVLDPLHPA